MNAISIEATQEIARLHGEILESARSSLGKAIRIGELLSGIRAGLKHGEWLPWAKDNLPFSDQTARNYIRVYERRDDPKFKNVLNLTDAYKLLSPPNAEDAEPEPEPKTNKERFRAANKLLQELLTEMEDMNEAGETRSAEEVRAYVDAIDKLDATSKEVSRLEWVILEVPVIDLLSNHMLIASLREEAASIRIC